MVRRRYIRTVTVPDERQTACIQPLSSIYSVCMVRAQGLEASEGCVYAAQKQPYLTALGSHSKITMLSIFRHTFMQQESMERQICIESLMCNIPLGFNM